MKNAVENDKNNAKEREMKTIVKGQESKEDEIPTEEKLSTD